MCIVGFGKVGMWDCMNLGLWEFGIVGIWDCGNLGLWEFWIVGMWDCGNWDNGIACGLIGISHSYFDIL